MGSMPSIQSIMSIPLARHVFSQVSLGEEMRTNGQHFITQPLSLAEATDIALQQNPSLRRARKEIEAAQGILIQTRAIVLPKFQLGGAFNAVQDSDVDKPPTTIPGFTFGTE